MKNGGIVTLLLLLPNAAWLIWGPKGSEETQAVPQLLETVENILRLAVFVLPFFYAVDISTRERQIAGLLSLLMLGGYYWCWGRYYLHNWDVSYFNKALFFVPVPMAVLPVLYLLGSSYLLHSILLGVSAALFGIVHVYISSVSLR
jgi:hypothetical protein